MEPNGAKRKRFSAEARREQILQVATRLFARHGFRGTRLRQLARAAGISEAVIYRHFPSKSALYDAMLERKIATAAPFLPQDAQQTGEPWAEVIRRVVSTFLHRQSQDSAFMRMILFSALEDHEMARKFVQRPLQAFLGRLGEYLEKQNPHAPRTPLPGAVMARLLIGMAYYMALQREILQDPVARELNLDELAGAIARVFVRGIEAT